ncbi:MAG: N-acetylneuraminate synthase [Epsilonproteobacteria bacterium]|nr:N-acetylneuraminate synthase [Campylobacterota bacterium]
MKIIAEIGSNHEGNLELACEMIREFAKAGADIIKFQAFVVDDMVPKSAPYYEKMKKLEVKKEWYPVLIKECEKAGVEFLSTATSFKSLRWMEEAGAKMYKVASANATHIPIIDKLIEIGKPVILSLGLLEMGEIIDLVEYFEKKGFDLNRLSLLHCHVEYPTPIEKSNLKNITVLKEMFADVTVGYSDHTLSILTPSIAVALGAEIIEKHVYLKKGPFGMDYDTAVSLDEFKEMVNNIKETQKMLKSDFRIDKKTKFEYRRSFHAKRDIKKGEILSFENLKISRPEDGIEPKYYKDVIGREIKIDIKEGEAIQWEML